MFDPVHDSIKVMTLHISKGLEFPVVALLGAGHMPAEGEDEREEARLFYVRYAGEGNGGKVSGMTICQLDPCLSVIGVVVLELE